VYPALAVLQALTKESDGPVGEGQEKASSDPPSFPTKVVEALWVGGVGGMEVNLVEREGIPFETIPAAGVHGVGLGALPGNFWQLIRGFVAARGILNRFRPEVLLYTGGYLAVPMALAARIPGLNRPRPRSLLYVPDIEPGLALKTLARFADQVAVTAIETKTWLPGRAKVALTGYPLRKDLQVWNPKQAREAIGVLPDLPVLLVFGGSKGARSLNQAVLQALPQLLAEMQLIHISGQLDWAEIKRAGADLPVDLAARYHAYPYLHEEMGAAMTIADLAVSRAGASVLGELTYFGLPAILVPYPYAWRYQKVNASFLAERGAAVVIADELIGSNLLQTVRELMEDEHRRNQMRREMRSLSRPQAADCIADLLRGLAVRNPQEGC
jgi:UDP-N-acetylglucosamine--N-acetylmuramyl-(pentapeptide) pyrophosphoryl-undecaprenol N-acetylglucosamine transferase